MIMNAIRDAEELVRWAEPNTIALNDEGVEGAVLCALSTPSASGVEMGVPMLRPCDPDRPAVPLLDVLVGDLQEFRSCCDRCKSKSRPEYRLWIPAGATVAELVCCWHCRNVLDDAFSGLVWR